MNKSVLITGITGFLGSHLAEDFLKNNYSVIGLKRVVSDIWRVKNHVENIQWVDVDTEEWRTMIVRLRPEIIIHAAWHGASAGSRNDLPLQLENLRLLGSLLQIAKEVNAEKFVGCGSQAEYGRLRDVVSESQPTKPDNAYAIAKVLAGDLTKQYCSLHSINWYWLRIFSVFGERESEQWLIPSVIKQLYLDGDLRFSPCTQKYAYMYVKDFSKAVVQLVSKSSGVEPGVYNISAQGAISLRSVIEEIREITGQNDVVLNFGALSQRRNQSTHIEGSMGKFINNVEPIEYRKLRESLKKTIEFYQSTL
jgi:nucleoside-diphosphate-sugar epimerase